jgi:hypothetical protein
VFEVFLFPGVVFVVVVRKVRRMSKKLIFWGRESMLNEQQISKNSKQF